MADDQIDPRLKAFFDQQIAPILIPLFEGLYPLQHVQQRFKINHNLILQRYLLPIDIKVIAASSPAQVSENGLITFGTSTRDRQVKVELYLVGLEKMHTLLRDKFSQDYREMWESFVSVGFIHELDHLANGWVDPAPDDLDAIVRCESSAWAVTCEQMILPLVQTCGKKVGPNNMQYYNEWLQSGRCNTNASWEAFIRRMYQKVKYR